MNQWKQIMPNNKVIKNKQCQMAAYLFTANCLWTVWQNVDCVHFWKFPFTQNPDHVEIDSWMINRTSVTN